VIPIEDSRGDPVEQVLEHTGGQGADRGCECVGYQAHDPRGQEHPIMTMNNLVRSVRFTWHIGVVGIFLPYDPGGHDDLALRDLIHTGRAHPSWIVSYQLPLDRAPRPASTSTPATTAGPRSCSARHGHRQRLTTTRDVAGHSAAPYALNAQPCRRGARLLPVSGDTLLRRATSRPHTRSTPAYRESVLGTLSPRPGRNWRWEDRIMTARVGVIGAGMIGTDHIRRLSGAPTGAAVVAVADVDPERAQRQADGLPGARVYSSGQDLIASDDVDAVLVASSGPTHEEYVLAAIAAGKHVFSEKPLATTQEACQRILAAEMSCGRRLVQVGYMRRYDPGYRALKSIVDDGSIGAPTLIHAAHRNPVVPDNYTSDMAIIDTAVHDIDTTRWLLGEEIVGVRVLTPRRNSHAASHLSDPIVLLLETESGVLADIEVNVNISYGYDIRGEVVGETGTAELADTCLVVVRADGHQRGRVPADWQERFSGAYDLELADWIGSVATGDATGPSAWDGYAVSVVSDAAVAAASSGERVVVSLPEQPAFYENPVGLASRT
jgi:myo-inositol 2-dehydrogenase/D-chiro-inositol 1-dehydrogenase